MRFNYDTVQPGDVLLYARQSWFNWLIRIKTWSRFTHVEVAVSTEHVFASRNGQGVAFYRPDLSGLAVVLRPTEPLNVAQAALWGKTVIGQGYDWLGLINFTYARVVGKQNGRMFCSEAVTRFLRAGGLDLFPRNDADTISPRDFSVCPWLEPVWLSDNEAKLTHGDI